MLAYTYIEQGKFELREKPIPEIQDSWDAIVRVTLGSICSSDLHIKHGSVPRAVPGITVGHEMVGVVEKVGADVTVVKPGDSVSSAGVDMSIIVPIPMAVGRWAVVSMGGRRSMSGFLMRIEA